MLNSKFAPVVALTLLAVVFILALGYFFAVKPQLDEASSLSSREALVRNNIAAIEADSASLNQRRTEIDTAPDLAEVTNLNAPSSLDLPKFLSRVGKAARSSKVEIRDATLEGVSAVEAWTVDPALRPSGAVAALFQTLGTPRLPGEPNFGTPFEPVVTPAVEGGTNSGNLTQVDFSVGVKGRPEEVLKFLAVLAAEDQRLFLVYDIEELTKQSTDSASPGLAAYLDGDMELTVRGSLFLLDPDYSIVDEAKLGDYAISKKVSPGLEPEPSDPQPGAP